MPSVDRSAPPFWYLAHDALHLMPLRSTHQNQSALLPAALTLFPRPACCNQPHEPASFHDPLLIRLARCRRLRAALWRLMALPLAPLLHFPLLLATLTQACTTFFPLPVTAARPVALTRRTAAAAVPHSRRARHRCHRVRPVMHRMPTNVSAYRLHTCEAQHSGSNETSSRGEATEVAPER